MGKKSSKHMALMCLTAISIVFATVAIVCTIAAAVVYHSTLSNSNVQIKTLQQRAGQLENSVNQSVQNLQALHNEQSANTTMQIKELSNKYQTTAVETNETVNMLIMQLVSNQDNLSISLHNLETTITQMINETTTEAKNSLQTTTDSVSDLSADTEESNTTFEHLQMDANSHVKLYNNCQVETKHCIIQGIDTTTWFWSSCNTNSTTTNTTDYFSVDMHCEYETNDNSNTITATLIQNHMTDAVHCQCSMIRPTTAANNDEFEFQEIPAGFWATCKLLVIRCPLQDILTRNTAIISPALN